MRREAHGGAKLLLNFRNVAVCPELIRLDRFIGFGKMIGKGGSASGSGDAGLGVDDHKVAQDALLCQRQER